MKEAGPISPACPRSLVPLRKGGSVTPLFCIHGLGGHVAVFLPLAQTLTAGRPVHGLLGQGLDVGQEPQDSIAAMAEFYLSEIRAVQPRGPYLLCGWSLGGLIALEAAHQLQAVGETTALVAMFDTYLSLADLQTLAADDPSAMRWVTRYLKLPAALLSKLPLDRQWDRIAEHASRTEGVGVAEIRRLATVCQAHLAAIKRHQPQPYSGPAVLFQADPGRAGLNRQWTSLCLRLIVEPVPGDHYSMLRKPNVAVLAERLEHYLREDQAGTGRTGSP